MMNATGPLVRVWLMRGEPDAVREWAEGYRGRRAAAEGPAPGSWPFGSTWATSRGPGRWWPWVNPGPPWNCSRAERAGAGRRAVGTPIERRATAPRPSSGRVSTAMSRLSLFRTGPPGVPTQRQVAFAGGGAWGENSTGADPRYPPACRQGDPRRGVGAVVAAWAPWQSGALARSGVHFAPPRGGMKSLRQSSGQPIGNPPKRSPANRAKQSLARGHIPPRSKPQTGWGDRCHCPTLVPSVIHRAPRV